MARIAIIGAGAMGLSAAYHCLKAGHKVVVYESDSVAGGMAAHFHMNGVSIERYYHFICKTDYPTFSLMEELGISDKLRWRDTYMGYYINGKLFDWGDPKSLLKFPLMNIIQKIRYGVSAFWQTKRKNFDSIEALTATDWIKRDCGEKTYNLLWRRLFELKFYEYTSNISASWIATRVQRTGRSRRSIMQESLGYIEGGTETLINELIQAIEKKNGEIRYSSRVQSLESKNGKINSVVTEQGVENFDYVISTIPTPLISKIVPDLTRIEKEKYDAIANIGVICLVFNLRKSISPKFWMNIVDERIEIPGIIEFSNLREFKSTFVYVPYYMPITNKKFSWSDQQISDEAWGYLKMLKPDLQDADKISVNVARLKYGQPICEPNFYEKIPPIQTSITGLQIADTSFYYPEDRGIAQSVRFGKMMADNINADS